MQIFSLGLACILSVQATETELTFTVVFVVMLVGALLLTSNVVLLGGSVSLLQAVSLLGYCMFPLDLAALGCSFVRFLVLCISWRALLLCVEIFMSSATFSLVYGPFSWELTCDCDAFRTSLRAHFSYLVRFSSR